MTRRPCAQALGEMLRVLGYRVETYASADAFLEALSGPRPGCIVADVRMPGMDGIELVRELSRRGIALPVVLISGHGDVPMAVAAIKAGAEDFIEKPVDDAHLLAAINRCLARALDKLVREQSLEELRGRFERLTPREVEVMDLVVDGFTSQAIALRLGISQRTVESYRGADHGQDAGRKRRRAGAAGHPPRPDRSVKLPPDRCGYPGGAGAASLCACGRGCRGLAFAKVADPCASESPSLAPRPRPPRISPPGAGSQLCLWLR